MKQFRIFTASTFVSALLLLGGCWQSETNIYQAEDYHLPVEAELISISDGFGPLGLYSVNEENQYTPIYKTASPNSPEQMFRTFDIGFVPIDRMATYRDPHEDWETNPRFSNAIFQDDETRLYVTTAEQDQEQGQLVFASYIKSDVFGICSMLLQDGKGLHAEFNEFASMRAPERQMVRKTGIATLVLSEATEAKNRGELECDQYKIKAHESLERSSLFERAQRGDALRKANAQRETEKAVDEAISIATPSRSANTQLVTEAQNTMDVFAQVTARPQNTQDPQLDWIKGLIGSWRFTSSTGSQIVALIWPLEYQGRPSRVLGFAAATADGQCIYEIVPMMTPSIRNERDRRRGFKRATEGDIYAQSLLNVRFATNVAGTNGRVSKKIPYEVQRACLERLKVSGYFVFDPETQSFSYAQDDFEETTPLVRTPLTPALETYLAHEERRYTQRGDDLRILPDADLRRIFANPSLTFSASTSQRGPLCRFQASYAYYRLQSLGVRQISTFRLNDQVAEVTLQYWRRDDDGWVGETAQYRDQGAVDWEHLNLKGYDLAPDKTSCQAAQAVLQYVDASNAGRVTRLNQERTAIYEKIDDITQTYIVDQNGVDKVSTRKIDTGAGLHSRNYTTRLFGRTNSFVKGDITREFDWEPTAQSMQLFGYVKADSLDAKATRDDLGSVRRINVRHDATISERFGAPVFQSTRSAQSSDTCLIWENAYRKSNCVMRARVGEMEPISYVTTSEAAAIALFKVLSPDQKTWTDGLPKNYCPGGAFCNVTMGDYFNAIYRDDAEAVRRLDRNYTSVEGKISEDLIPDERVRRFFGIDAQQLTPFYMALNAYMHNYKNNPEECFKPGAKRLKFADYIPGTETRTMSGILLDSTSGTPLYAEYDVNKEFIPLCEDICTADGPREMSSFVNQVFGSGNVASFERGLREINANYDCDSDELKMFETNLIKEYYRRKNRPPVRFYRNSF